VVPDS
jgi:hypothetical protein